MAEPVVVVLESVELPTVEATAAPVEEAQGGKVDASVTLPLLNQ